MIVDCVFNNFFNIKMIVLLLLLLLFIIYSDSYQIKKYNNNYNKYQSSKFDYPFPDRNSEWYSSPGDCLVLFPTSNEPVPKSIIHFIGGFLVGNVVTVTYSTILEELSNNGHIIVASPIPISKDHSKISAEISKMFTKCYKEYLTPILGNDIINIVPLISLSHSLGGKLSSLSISRKEDRKIVPLKKASVYMSYNNYGFSQSINLTVSQATKLYPEMGKFVENLRDNDNVQNMVDNFMKGNSQSTGTISDIFNNAIKKSSNNLKNTVNKSGLGSEVSELINDVIGKELNKIGDVIVEDFEFIPSPDETWDIIKNGYNVQKNILIKFDKDEIDQSLDLAVCLRQRGCDIKIINFEGNHLTPNDSVPGSTDSNTILFSKKLSSIMNQIALDIWDQIDEDKRKRYQLPKKISKSDSDTNWDSDDF